MLRSAQRTTPGGRRVTAILASLLVMAGCGSTVPTSGTQQPASTHQEVVAATAPAPTPAAATAVPTPATPVAPARAATGAWTITGSITAGHSYGSTATVLRDGRVLVVGGESGGLEASAAAALYDPVSGQWTTTGSLHYPRRSHTATLLADGRVLVAGGWNYESPTPPMVAEVYDPATGTWSDAGRMVTMRSSPKSVTLRDGRVLVLGGNGSGRGGEVFQPATREWRAIRRMTAPPEVVAPLSDGRVLVTHGAIGSEIFDPTHDSWTGTTSAGAGWNQSVALADGAVLVLNGQDGLAETFDPVAGTWSRTPGWQTGRGLAATLPDGSVVMIGVTSSARRDPETGSWTPISRPPLPRDYALPSRNGVELRFLVALHDGRLLATEGGDAAIFDPAGVSEPVTDLPATRSAVDPGRYATAFEPSVSLSIGDAVQIDCAPGLRCQGEVAVNRPNWVDVAFGHDHPIELTAMRLDTFVGANGRVVASPDDLAAWVASRPHLSVLARADVTIGGKAATQLDVRSDDQGVVFGPTGLRHPADFAFGPAAYRRLVVVKLRWANVVVMLGSVNAADERDPEQFASAIHALQPIVDSISWY